ncbi:hypothetical protein V8F20_002983 [Naviculisporaceae sp. PSN 640]
MQPKFIFALMATFTSVMAQIPAEVPVRTDATGNIIPFGRRDLGRRQIPAEVAVKTDGNGNVVPFEKRSITPRGAWKREPIAQIPAEVPTRSGPDGIPVPFGRR